MTTLIIPRSTIIIATILIMAIAAAIFFYLYLPQAEIIIEPATFSRSVEQEITLSSSATEPDFVRFILPTKIVTAEVSQQQQLPRSTGSLTADYAKGVITLHNELNEEQPLLPKTHLRHEATGVYYLTDQAVRLPIKNTVAVAATAKEIGVTGNVPAGRWIVEKLPTDTQAFVYGESTIDFTGGEISDTALTETELNDAKSQLRTLAEEKAMSQLQQNAGGPAFLPELININVTSEQSSAAVGSNAATLALNVSLIAHGFVVDENDVLGLAIVALQANPNANEDFVSYNPDSFKVELVRADFDRGEVRIKASLSGNYAKQRENAIFDVSNLAGRTQEEVREYFKQFDSVGPVRINFWPFWVKVVPTKAKATTIIIENEENKEIKI